MGKIEEPTIEEVLKDLVDCYPNSATMSGSKGYDITTDQNKSLVEAEAQLNRIVLQARWDEATDAWANHVAFDTKTGESLMKERIKELESQLKGKESLGEEIQL